MHKSVQVNPCDFLQRNALTNPDGIFLESAGTKLLNSEALTYVEKIAFELRRVGLSPGALVALDLPSELTLLFTEALFHEALVGCVLPSRFGQHSEFQVDWVIGSDPEKQGSGHNFLLVDGKFLRQIEDNPVGTAPRTFPSPQTICRLVFTSGTTGKPKAVALSYEMIEFRSRMAATVWMRDPPFMSLLDASTVSGFFTFYSSVMEDRPYLAPGTMEHNVDLLKRKSIRSIKASPAQVAELVRQLESTQTRLPELRSAQIAGSVLPPSLATRLRERTGSKILNMYGSTEIGTVSARYLDSDDPFDAGFATPGSTIEIVDEFDQPLPAGKLGLIRCKRPLMTDGYFHDANSSNTNFKNGWFYPGDYGILQPGGSLTLGGRQSEFINAGGIKLDPVQLDLFAVALPHVLDACGFSYPDSSGMQQIGLAVVTSPHVDGQAIAASLEKAFGPAAPRLLVRVDEIPRNAMGKPLRAEIARHHTAPDIR